MVDNQGQLTPLASLPQGTVKAQNAAFFNPAPTTKFNNKSETWYVILLAFEAAHVLQFTIDGVNWLPFNGGVAFQAQNFQMPRPLNALLNFRCTDVAGCTIEICDISESGGT